MKTLLYVAAASLLSGTAFAGGYVAPVVPAEPVTVVPVAQETDWTGFYAGLQYGQGDADADGAAIATSGDLDAYGLHAGYLHDFGKFILGGEFSYDKVDFDDFDSDGDLWRLRARAGYDLGRFQPYATLGAARFSGDLSDTGVTYGIGAEYLVTDRFSVGLEYSRIDFSDFDDTDVDVDTDLVQIRASYRF